MFGIPYVISACGSPFFGFLVDKVGKRALFITLSSIILMGAFTTSYFLPSCDKCYNELYASVLVGMGYTIYCSCIWGSIPYTVDP